jgi:Flp pilus assembly protein TadG
MHKQRAQTVVEFALLTPILILLVLGILGVGRAFYTYVDLTSAARAGVRYAITRTDCDNTGSSTDLAAKASITSTAKASQQDLSWPAVATITADCPTDRRTVTIANYPFDTFTPGIGQLTLTATATLPF